MKQKKIFVPRFTAPHLPDVDLPHSARDLVAQRQKWGNVYAFATRLTIASWDPYLMFALYSICKAVGYILPRVCADARDAHGYTQQCDGSYAQAQ